MSAQSYIYDLVDTLKDSEYTSGEDFEIAIDEEIDNLLIYTDNIFNIARSYVSVDKIIPLFIEEFTNDVYAAIYEDEDLREYLGD